MTSAVSFTENPRQPRNPRAFCRGGPVWPLQPLFLPHLLDEADRFVDQDLAAVGPDDEFVGAVVPPWTALSVGR